MLSDHSSTDRKNPKDRFELTKIENQLSLGSPRNSLNLTFIGRE